MSYPQYGKRGALDGGYGGYKIPKLSYESPRGYVLEVKVYMCLGRRPPSPMAPRSRGHTLEKSTKVALAPLCNRGRRTHLRVAALPAASCFHFFFREPLVTRPRPAQPLLLTADSAGKLAPFCHRSASPSPLRGHACSLNASAQRTRVRLVPGSMPAHADPCGENVSFTG